MEADKLLKQAILALNYEEVYRLYEEIYNDPNDLYDREEGLPPDLSIMQKAGLLSENGKHDEALIIYNTLLGMKTAEFGEKSRGAQYVRPNMAWEFLCQGKVEEALELLNDVLKNQIEILGDIKDASKPDAYETKHYIAMALEQQGKLEEALAMYEKVYEAFEEFNGAEVDYTAHVALTITSIKLKIAGNENENLNLGDILKIIDYGPTVLSIKEYGDDGKDTALHRATRSNVASIVEQVINGILEECGEDKEKVVEFLNFENSEVQTPLSLAVKYNCGTSVLVLLERGIEHGLDVNKITTFGEYPLKMAEKLGYKDIKKLLVEHKAGAVDESTTKE